MTTLDKVRVFERYLELTRGHADAMFDTVLDKLLERQVVEPPDLVVLGEIEKQLRISS